jgi:hypothetical protein
MVMQGIFHPGLHIWILLHHMIALLPDVIDDQSHHEFGIGPFIQAYIQPCSGFERDDGPLLGPVPTAGQAVEVEAWILDGHHETFPFGFRLGKTVVDHNLLLMGLAVVSNCLEQPFICIQQTTEKSAKQQ